MSSEVKDALEVAAGAGDDAIGAFECMARGDMRSTPSKRRITGARLVVQMFLENIPADMTAAEILEELG